MEKLNELADLANKATKGAWVADSGEGWDAIISQQDMVNSNFIIGEFIGPDSKANKDFVLAVSPENILAIAEEFRALEREVQKNLDGALAWQQRAEAAEAKLAELEKQEPAGYAVKRFDNGKFGSWLNSKGLAKGDDDYYVVPLFERPAPAVSAKGDIHGED